MTTSDLQIQHIGWACTLVGGFLCGLLTLWLLRPRPRRVLPKPVPYASARGSKPPAPWVTREEWLETEVCNSGLRDWQKHVFHELERRVTALENQRPKPVHEPLAHGVRVWKYPNSSDDGRLLQIGAAEFAHYDGEWHKWYGGARSLTGLVELHGTERDEVVRDWMNRGGGCMSTLNHLAPRIRKG